VSGTSKTPECTSSCELTVSACTCPKIKITGLISCYCIRIGKFGPFYLFILLNFIGDESLGLNMDRRNLFWKGCSMIVWTWSFGATSTIVGSSPEPVAGKSYYISQPGSSVATSLADGESVEKCVFPSSYLNPQLIDLGTQTRCSAMHPRQRIRVDTNPALNCETIRFGRVGFERDS
jgi:hypothetical protein